MRTRRCKEGPDDIIYRANMILAATDEEAGEALQRRDKQAAFPVRAGLRDALLQADVTRNIPGEKRPANVGGVLPISFCGGPDRWSSRSAAAARKSAPVCSTCHAGSRHRRCRRDDAGARKKVLPRIGEI